MWQDIIVNNFITTRSTSGFAFQKLSPEIKSLALELLKQETTLRPDYFADIIVTIVAIAALCLLIRYINKVWKLDEQRTIIPLPMPGEQFPYFIYKGSELNFSMLELARILEKHFPYYQSLTHELKQRFIERLKHFIHDKQFILWTNEGLKEMPVLVSATAIQLTFGLSRYMFPFFENMQIHPGEYFADNSMRVLAGHVQGNMVTVSWKHLLEGIKNGTDGSNVGLHEMAHAFYVQCTEADWIKEKGIVHHFDEIMAEGKDVYELRDRGTLLFSDYAFKDLQEFWAESVEIFFEKPVEMRIAYPELFESLVALLQQDPSRGANPLAI